MALASSSLAQEVSSQKKSDGQNDKIVVGHNQNKTE
jgi:hypothetical protein